MCQKNKPIEKGLVDSLDDRSASMSITMYNVVVSQRRWANSIVLFCWTEKNQNLNRAFLVFKNYYVIEDEASVIAPYIRDNRDLHRIFRTR